MKIQLSIYIAVAIILSIQPALHAQNVWRGGTPGQEREWNNPRNWSQNRAPDINDIALIPNTESRGGFYPVITDKAGPIYYLEVQGGASLTISSGGSLTVDGIGRYEDAILLVGALYNHGEIRINDGEMLFLAGHPENLMNAGKVTVINSRKKP